MEIAKPEGNMLMDVAGLLLEKLQYRSGVLQSNMAYGETKGGGVSV